MAIAGLGVGTLASFGKTGQEMVFYEIDPVVIRVAQDSRYFDYLARAKARGVNVSVVPGDARLQIAQAAERHFGAIILDAFNSDGIPTHLFTQEAIELYKQKLAPGGVLAFHISNRHLRLGPVVSELARATGLVALHKYDSETGADGQRIPGKNASDWVLLAEKFEDFGRLPSESGWESLPPAPGQPLWTDDFVNLLSIYRWD